MVRSRRRLLDLYCGAGGCSLGYARAGFDVTGVDIVPQPHYPFRFQLTDALSADLSGYDAIHASPPCQGYSALSAVHGNAHPMLIPATRKALDATGLPYVIENVAGAPIRHDVTLCGTMYGLPILFHRFFELSGFVMAQPPHPKHRGRVRGWRHGQYFDGPYLAVYGQGGGKASVAEIKTGKGIHWMTERRELTEAIPPAYTTAIGVVLMDILDGRDAA